MASGSRCYWGLSLSLTALFVSHSISTTSHVYIVYLGHTHGRDPLLTSEHHFDLLSSVFESKIEAKKAMLYSYKHAFSGFAVLLDANQATVLANSRGVISVFKSTTLDLHTTRSWDFMGLSIDYSWGTPIQLSHGDDIIVGIFDSGVWPELASFKEEPNMRPIPKHWKGKCVGGDEFNPKKHCNRKLIGAKYFLKGFEKQFGHINKTEHQEYISARDFIGHGTHTASTAVGSRVRDANLFGFARGIARGGAPRARLAVYKVCWSINFDGQCTEEDVLAAFDEALHDGVDVISASFGKPPPLRPFFASSSDIGSFHAMLLGVSVVFSAGNDGPDPSLVGNANPWSICVAASSMDRSFPTWILLEDGTSFVGEGLISSRIRGTLARATAYFKQGICDNANWMKSSAAGMILLCFSMDGPVSSLDAEFAARRANAAALIFVQPVAKPTAAISIVPVVRIDTIQGTKLQLLPTGTKAMIAPSDTAFGRSPAPMVAEYSSRGPSSISPNILKPDISAPGTNILAAWPPNVSPTVFGSDFDNRSVVWNFDSGTSMSCPHVSGVVALLKSAYPEWSPAAVRSALVTTAYNADVVSGDDILVRGSFKSSDAFDIGAGHMNPVKAFDPGLVYDVTPRDYAHFLCNIGYTSEQIRAMGVCGPDRCRDKLEPDWNLNYPAITLWDLRHAATVRRTVRNVGIRKTAVYFVRVEKPDGVEVVVWPRVLVFSPWKEEWRYYVTVTTVMPASRRRRAAFGWIIWSDGFHNVRSPLVVGIGGEAGGSVDSNDTNMAY
ncbi:subtilisin-like protease SBT3.18 [Andrographis paniculata]|uniref:subtilisin-like protease SBT3.18 n=1 Tax=Andrographis paniculata TaxID=175694 RepID=UPI0021E9430D|nr:subtilisin-like protease SBT3.18 [Andrographis paniculata]